MDRRVKSSSTSWSKGVLQLSLTVNPCFPPPTHTSSSCCQVGIKMILMSDSFLGTLSIPKKKKAYFLLHFTLSDASVVFRSEPFKCSLAKRYRTVPPVSPFFFPSARAVCYAARGTKLEEVKKNKTMKKVKDNRDSWMSNMEMSGSAFCAAPVFRSRACRQANLSRRPEDERTSLFSVGRRV